MQLRVCSTCQRHFSTKETGCPFCAEAVGPIRLGPRSAAVLGGLAVALVGCGESTTPTADAGQDVIQVQPYGIAPIDAGAEDTPSVDAGEASDGAGQDGS